MLLLQTSNHYFRILWKAKEISGGRLQGINDLWPNSMNSVISSYSLCVVASSNPSDILLGFSTLHYHRSHLITSTVLWVRSENYPRSSEPVWGEWFGANFGNRNTVKHSPLSPPEIQWDNGLAQITHCVNEADKSYFNALLFIVLSLLWILKDWIEMQLCFLRWRNLSECVRVCRSQLNIMDSNIRITNWSLHERHIVCMCVYKNEWLDGVRLFLTHHAIILYAMGPSGADSCRKQKLCGTWTHRNGGERVSVWERVCETNCLTIWSAVYSRKCVEANSCLCVLHNTADMLHCGFNMQ